MSLRVYYPTFQVVKDQPWITYNPFRTSFCDSPFARFPSDDVSIAIASALFEQLAAKTKKNKEQTTKDDKPLIFKIDLAGFKPKDIKLKTAGQKLIINATKEENKVEKDCESYSLNKYHKTIILPDEVNPENVTSSLNNDGILVITAPVTPLPVPEEKEIEFTVEEQPSTSNENSTENEKTQQAENNSIEKEENVNAESKSAENEETTIAEEEQ